MSQCNAPGVEGSDYEVNLLTLFSLKALFSDKITDFIIESNNAKYGKFDDIILTLAPKEGEEIKVAFQLKHRINVKVLKREQMEHSKGDFSISKYLESYRDEIKLEDKQNCHYVLFTNNKIDNNSFNSQGSILSIIETTSDISFNTLINICDSHKIHKFRNNKDVNQNEFLDRFYLFSEQCNEKEVESEIQMILKNFGSNETANTASVLKLFRDIHKGRFIDKRLDKATLVYHLINLLIIPHSINLKQGDISQDSLCEHFYNAVKLFDVTHISCENMDFLKQNLRHIDNVSEANPFRWARDHKFIDREMRDADFQINSHCRILYHIDNQPIVLSYSRDSAKAINCVMKICNKKLPQIKFILAGRETDFMDLYRKDPELNSSSIFENLSSLRLKDERVYQQLISQFDVEVNGRKLTSLTEFLSFDVNIANNWTPSVIINSAKTSVVQFGDERSDELPPNYIPRQILGDLVSVRNIAEDKNILFIISCSKHLDKMQDFFKTKNLISIDFDRIENKTKIRTNIILTASENITEHELNEKIEHKFRKICYLEVIVDNGCFLGYLRFRKREKNDLKKIIVEEKKIQKYFQKSIEIISATPGMGKTSLMKSILKNYPPNYFCILIPLKDYSDFFKKKHSTVDLLNEYFHKENVSANFQSYLTNYIFHKFKVLFLFDGFDEIDRRCHNNLFKCVTEVRNNGQKVWISTRPNFSELLQNQFDVNDLEIVEFNKKTQKRYIKNRLSESNKLNEIDPIITKIYKNIVIERHQTLLGTPLLLHMITEMIINNEEDLLNINNITDLFKYFFKGKFIHHMKKHGSSTFVEEYFNAKLDSYTIPSLQLCLGTDLFNKLNLYTNTEQVDNLRKSGDGLGIIVNVSGDRDDPNFSFFHNTYAEYFAAKWLAANCTQIPIEARNFLLEDRFENLKFMFDNFIAEGCPAHIAVLCGDEKRLANCTEDEIVMTDKLNRSVWHIICASGDKFPYTGISYSDEAYIVDSKVQYFKPKNRRENLFKYLNNNKIPLLKRDSLFHKTSLEYATERFSINIVDFIIKIIKIPNKNFHNISRFSNNKILILYYSIKFGYLNVLQFDLMQSVLAIQTLTYAEYDDFTGLLRKGNAVNIAVKYKQLKVLKYLYTFANKNDMFKDPLLRWAAEQGHTDIVKELIENNADVNAADADDKTPIFLATYQGHLEIVKELIAHNADVNATDKSWGTLLLVATEQGHLDIVKELIANNADVNATDKDGRTPLLVASAQGHSDIVKELIPHNANISATNKNRETSLFVAIKQGHLSIVKMFIEHNADVCAMNKDGRTPLLVAAEQGHINIVRELIAHKADVNAADNHGRTPLWWAVYRGCLQIVQELIAHNVDFNTTDKGWGTLLLVATKQGHLHIVKELITQNADVNARDNNERTPLWWAVYQGHQDIVKELITHNADVNATANYEMTPLGWAAYQGDLGIVKELITHNADVNATDKYERTPLLVATEQGHLDIIEELVTHNADVNATDNYERTPLLVAAEQGHLEIVKLLTAHNAVVNTTDNYGRTPLCWAIYQDHPDMVKEMIENGADVSTTDRDGRTPLVWAACHGHLDIVKELIAHNADVNVTDKYGVTPLFWAAEKGHLEIIKELIEHSADVNATDKDGETPLFWAANQGHLSIVKELMKHNADVNATNKYGKTPFCMAVDEGHVDIVKELIGHDSDINATHNEGKTLFCWAAYHGHLNLIKELIAQNADVNATDNEGETPLCCAAYQGHLEIVQELIEHSADVNAADKDGYTPLFWAANQGHLDIVKELIAHNADVNATDNDGWTPLSVVAKLGYFDVVKELIEHNADVNATDKYGRTPLRVAVDERHLDIVKELIAHNADVNAADNDGWTPLSRALYQGHPDVCEVIWSIVDIVQ